MNTVILFWNPEISSFKYEDFTNSIKNIKTETFNWSVWEHDKAKKGDSFFLVKCGEGKNNGICMSGHFISDPYLGAHWNGKGGEVYYMDMKIDAAINPLYFPVLPAEELQKLFPAFDWTGGHSGRVLPKIYSPQSLWQRFIEQNKGFFEPQTYLDSQKQKDFTREDFVFFWHEYPHNPVSKTCLSQWYDCEFYVSGKKYFTAEQYMMASKALLFNDLEIYGKIFEAKTPQEFKNLGKLVKNYDSNTWNAHKDRIVIEGNIAKFSQNPDLKNFLLSTGDKILAEASPVDKIWGIGLPEDDVRVLDPANWQGENHLGNALMKVREMLRQ
ncbi:MAG: NADAR family protein [Bacteroidales bacterium]|nr:NADAR family protein [Bacteroidales bacterium]MEE3447142.1 NADAR family protein [Bacteroidales bacterium]